MDQHKRSAAFWTTGFLLGAVGLPILRSSPEFGQVAGYVGAGGWVLGALWAWAGWRVAADVALKGLAALALFVGVVLALRWLA